MSRVADSGAFLYSRVIRACACAYTALYENPPPSATIQPGKFTPKIPPHRASTPHPRIYPLAHRPHPPQRAKIPTRRAHPNLTRTPHTTYRADVPIFWLGGEVVGDLSLSLVRVPRGWSCPQAPRAPGRPAAAIERAPAPPQPIEIISRKRSGDICQRTNAVA